MVKYLISGSGIVVQYTKRRELRLSGSKLFKKKDPDPANPGLTCKPYNLTVKLNYLDLPFFKVAFIYGFLKGDLNGHTLLMSPSLTLFVSSIYPVMS